MKENITKLFGLIINLYSFFYISLFITDYSFIYKKGLSNTTGFTIFLLVLFLARWLLEKKTFSQLFIFRKLRILFDSSNRFLLIFFSLYILLILSVLGALRHLSLSTMAWDMGIFEQAYWNTLQGNMFFSSVRNMNLLGDHFQPILFVFLPFYALWPHVFTLIVMQAIILAVSVFPLYLIAKDKLNNRLLVFAFVISFVLSKAVRGIGLSDFHPESFIVCLSLFAFYFLIKKRDLLFFITILLILACKETAVLIISGFGIYALVSQRRMRLGIFLVILGILSWLIETRLIIPFFNLQGKFPYYARMPFGNTYKQNLMFVLKQPLDFLRFVFLPGKIDYFLRLIVPLGFLPLLAPSIYILVILPAIIILLASKGLGGYYDLTSHYSSHVLPFIYIAAIYGTNNLLNFLKKNSRFNKISLRKACLVLGSYTIVMSLLFYSKTDAYKLRRFVSGIKKNKAFEKLSYLKSIPKDASVSASSNLVPHMAHRKYIFDFNPESARAFMAEYIVIDLNFIGYLSESSKQKIPSYFLELSNKGYKKIFSNDEESFFIYFNLDIDKTLLENYTEECN